MASNVTHMHGAEGRELGKRTTLECGNLHSLPIQKIPAAPPKSVSQSLPAAVCCNAIPSRAARTGSAGGSPRHYPFKRATLYRGPPLWGDRRGGGVAVERTRYDVASPASPAYRRAAAPMHEQPRAVEGYGEAMRASCLVRSARRKRTRGRRSHRPARSSRPC